MLLLYTDQPITRMRFRRVGGGVQQHCDGNNGDNIRVKVRLCLIALRLELLPGRLDVLRDAATVPDDVGDDIIASPKGRGLIWLAMRISDRQSQTEIWR